MNHWSGYKLLRHQSQYIPQFLKEPARCEKYLNDNKLNSLHLAHMLIYLSFDITRSQFKVLKNAFFPFAVINIACQAISLGVRAPLDLGSGGGGVSFLPEKIHSAE